MKSTGLIQALSLSLGVALVSCTDENVCGKNMVESGDDCVFPKDSDEKDEVIATVRIPDDFDGTPVLLAVNFFDNPDMHGKPAGFGDQISKPDIEAGKAFQLASTQADLEGDFFMSIIIYCEGGGNGKGPVADIDWVNSKTIPVTLGSGTGPVDAGDITLNVFKAPEK